MLLTSRLKCFRIQYVYKLKWKLDCAVRAQTSAKASNLDQKSGGCLNPDYGFVYSADACNVARVSFNVARVSCNITGNT